MDMQGDVETCDWQRAYVHGRQPLTPPTDLKLEFKGPRCVLWTRERTTRIICARIPHGDAIATHCAAVTFSNQAFVCVLPMSIQNRLLLQH